MREASPRRMAAVGVLLLAVALAPSGPVASAQTPGKGTVREDTSALYTLARAWNRPPSLAGWFIDDPCDATRSPADYGLTCTALAAPVLENGVELWWRVTEIRLNSSPKSNRQYNIAGPLPSAAFQPGMLAALQILDISYNKVTGTIPAEVGNLSNLTRLALNNNQMTGTIPAELSQLSSLDIFWLGMNNLTGTIPTNLAALAPTLHSFKVDHNQLYSQIPDFLNTLTNLVHIDLAYNKFSLGLPDQITQLTNLSALYLHNNFLSGTIPSTYGDFKSLMILKLSHNQLTGSIPIELTKCTTLQQLVLNDNQLVGSLPDALAQMPGLAVLSLQTNNFTGLVGPAFAKWPMGFRYNNKLCNDLSGKGYQPCACTDGQTGQQKCDPVSGPGPCVCPEGSLPADQGLSTAWIVVITIGGALMLLLLIALLWWGYRTSFGRKKAGGWEYAGKIRSFPDVRTYRSQAYDPDEIDGYGMQAYDQTPSSLHSRNPSGVSASGGDLGAVLNPGGGNSAGGGTPSSAASSTAAAFARKFGRSLNSQLTMRQFSFDELQLATNNFSTDNIVSTDGSRKTYSGVLPSGTYVAVKELDSAGSESAEAFAAAVEVFSAVRCPQLVEVLGFSCARTGSRLLVYELMPNGSLDLHLHDVEASVLALDWNTRMSIALEVAKALGYLHSMSPQMVHQHLQASTVLLDDHFHAKLSDYCLDSLRPHQAGAMTHAASTNVAVAAGTAAPELAWSSQPTPRTDVYAFGVLLLEIIAGRRPIDSARPATEQSLVRWAKPRLMERSQVEGMVDMKLAGNFSSAALYQVALLASQCIQTDPEGRPSMTQAVDVLQNVQGLPLDNKLNGKAT